MRREDTDTSGTGAAFTAAAVTSVDRFAAFVDALPGGRAFVDAVDDVAFAETPDEVLAALRRIFVDRLGFAASQLDETPRLGQQTTVRRLRRVATHESFVVSLVELASSYAYTVNIVPVFRLHPFGLVVACTPGYGTVRLFFRRTGERAHHGLQVRTLVGGRTGRDPGDNALVWARRLALLRPRFGEDAASLAQRVEEVVGAPAADIGRNWPSVAFDERAAPPGASWEGVFHGALDAFLQTGARGRRHLCGLERALRDAFPMRVGVHGVLACRGYDVVAAADDLLEAWRRAVTATRRVRLRLEFVGDDGRRVPMEVEAAVPALDDRGRFVIDGAWWRFVPRLRAGGSLVPGRPAHSSVAADDTEDVLPDVSDAHDESDGDEETSVEDAIDALGRVKTSGPAEPSGPLEPTGADVETLLVTAAHFKLGAAAAKLYDLAADADPVGSTRQVLAHLRGGESHLLLVAKNWLRSRLDCSHVDDERPVAIRAADDSAASAPPPWACLDVSADLPVGQWYPVASARLDPTGNLAVPVRSADGGIRLGAAAGTAVEVNPRSGGGAPGPRAWWAASGLALLARVPAGGIESAARLLHSGTARAMAGVVRAGSSTRLRLTPWLRPAVLRRRRLHADVPSPHWRCAEGGPAPQVEPGARIEAGAIWLKASAEYWGVEPPRRRLAPHAALADCLFGIRPYEGPMRCWRVPVGVRGVVEQVRVEEVRYRGLLVGWRATLDIILPATGTASGGAVAFDGRSVPVDFDLAPEDAPCRPDGTAAWVVLETPQLAGLATEEWLDPVTEGSVPVAVMDVVAVWSPPEHPDLVVGPDLHLARRGRDGEGIPSGVDAPALSAAERRWWAARSPGTAATLVRLACEHAGGAPPSWLRIVELLRCAGVTAPIDDRDDEDDEPTADADVICASDAEAAGNDEVAPRGEADENDDSGDPYEDAPEAPGSDDAFDERTAAPLESADDDADAEGEEPPAGAVRWPVHTATKNRSDPIQGTGFGGPVALRCECGALKSADRLAERCIACGRRVLPRHTLAGGRADASLPEPVVHPWYRPALAAALGLTSEELRERLLNEGTELAVAELDASLGTPNTALSNAHARIVSLPAGQTRNSLARAATLLARLLASQGAPRLQQSAFLHSVPLLPSYLHPTGAPPGAPGRVESRLTARTLEALRASDRMRRLEQCGAPDLLMHVARRRLYETIDALFGSVDQGPHDAEPPDLASLLARLWLPTRAAKLRSAVPGMAFVDGALADEGRDARLTRLLPPTDLAHAQLSARALANDGAQAAAGAHDTLAAVPALSTRRPAAARHSLGASQSSDCLCVALANDTRHVQTLDVVWTPRLLEAMAALEVTTIGELSGLPSERLRRQPGVGRKKVRGLHQALAVLAKATPPQQKPSYNPPRPRALPPRPTPLEAALELVPVRLAPAQRRAVLLAADRVVVFPAPRHQARAWEPSFWADRVARAAIEGRWLPRLSGVLATARASTLPSLLAALERPDARPAALHAVLSRSTALRLPRDEAEARNRLRGDVEAAFPGEDAATARECLLAMFAGWWRHAPTPEAPMGWTFTCSTELSSGGRALPPFSADAWTILECVDAVSAPVRWFLARAGEPVTTWPPLVRLLAGWPVESDAPEPIAVSTAERSEPLTVTTPAATSAADHLASEAARASVALSDLTFLSRTLRAWLDEVEVG